MNYQIVATLGPSTREEVTWTALRTAGATAFRLNTSHMSLEQVQEWLQRLAIFFENQGTSLPVVLDLQGSKWRVGRFEPFELQTGQNVRLEYSNVQSTPNSLPVPHVDFFRAASAASRVILLNDAKIQLEVETLGEEELSARVVRGGEISAYKGITFLESAFRAETISAKDQAIVEKSRQHSWVRWAVSYVRDGREMAHYRQQFGSNAYLIAKLERGPAVQTAQEVARSANELWVCRGDLGAELGLAGMAQAVAAFSQQVKSYKIPVLMAGQVLEHMTREQVPTRSEVCYLLDALQSGYQGFVLSDEVAIGQYPVESCRVAAMFRESN